MFYHTKAAPITIFTFSSYLFDTPYQPFFVMTRLGFFAFFTAAPFFVVATKAAETSRAASKLNIQISGFQCTPLS